MKHAPHAPGPRPNTWWKLGKRPLYDVLAAPSTIRDGVKVTPPIYTRPEPNKGSDRAARAALFNSLGLR